jgi:hypothetical protein
VPAPAIEIVVRAIARKPDGVRASRLLKNAWVVIPRRAEGASPESSATGHPQFWIPAPPLRGVPE